MTDKLVERRALAFLKEAFAEVNMTPVLDSSGYFGTRDKAALRALWRALASSSVPEQDRPGRWNDVEQSLRALGHDVSIIRELPKDGRP